MKKIIVFQLVFVLFVIGFLPKKSNAYHRFHTSFTRMDYNEKDKLIEVTIRLFTHDFESVFRKLTNDKINPENIEDIDKTILKYLNEKFVLTDENGSQKKLIWVGKEIKVDTTYIYVEIPFDRKSDNLKIQNTIFFESFDEQINYVSAHFGDAKSDLVFKVGDKFKDLEFKK